MDREKEIKSKSLNLALTEELRKFVQSQAGEHTLYSTPSEYVRDLIRHDKEKKEAQAFRDAVVDGYMDAINGRTIKFSGDLRADLELAKKKFLDQ